MFDKARLKLTAWYLLIIMLISISFSLAIYHALTDELHRFAKMQRLRMERRLSEEMPLPPDIFLKFSQPEIIESELVGETKNRLFLMFAMINGGILLFSGTIGYVLAGRTLQPIKDMMDEQNRFISDASHELRTPLTAMKTSMEVHLRDKKLTLKDARALIAGSVEDVNRLQSLSDALLQLAQYQKPNGNIPFEKVSIEDILREAVRSIEPLAGKRGIMIKTSLTAAVIEGNARELTDLFIILLDNALKYSPSGSEITLSAAKKDGSMIVSVKDQGMGISEKDIGHIFDRFYRADDARSKNSSGGYGLGLSIAKKIIDVHHGSITVQSKPEKGSIFIVRLPLKKKMSMKRDQ